MEDSIDAMEGKALLLDKRNTKEKKTYDNLKL